MASTYYVDGIDGNDSNNGLGSNADNRSNKPWKTIGKALGSAGISTDDTLWIAPGTYRETVDVAVGATGSVYIYGDTRGEREWKTQRTGRVTFTGWTTDDKTTASSSVVLDLSGEGFLNFARIEFVSGDNNLVSSTGAIPSVGCSFTDCAFINTYDGFSWIYYVHNDNTGGALNWTIDRCLFMGDADVIFYCPQNSGTGAWDTGLAITNSIFYRTRSDWTIQVNSQGGVNPPSNGFIRGCTIFASRGFLGPASWDASGLFSLQGNIIIAFTGGVSATSSTTVASDYNIINSNTPFTNIVQGTNDQTVWLCPLEFTHSSGVPGMIKRQLFEPLVDDAAQIGQVANANHPTHDLLNRPRPGSGVTTDTVGALERGGMATQETGTTITPRGGSGTCWMLDGPGIQDLLVSVDSGRTVLSIWVYTDTTPYSGSFPSVSILNGEHLGVSDETISATSASNDAWEQLFFSPFYAVEPGVITIRLTNNSTTTAGQCAFDDIDGAL